MAQKQALGKGLASLLPGASKTKVNIEAMGAVTAGPPTTVDQAQKKAPSVSNSGRLPGITFAPIEELRLNPYQPRHEFDETRIKELAGSIQENGIIQPLVVRRTEKGYQLIAGERRLRAAKLAGVKQVPVVIRHSTDREALELALLENIQRQDLNCMEEAHAYYQLMEEFSLTQEKVAQKMGKDRASVANALRLLKLPDSIQKHLKENRLSFGHGKALASLEDREKQRQTSDRILEEKLSVRQTEDLIAELKSKTSLEEPSEPTISRPLSKAKQRLAQLAQQLTRHWATRVEVKGSERRGKIVIHYGARQELDRVLQALQSDKIWPENQT